MITKVNNRRIQFYQNTDSVQEMWFKHAEIKAT